jgi:hypothetical protein
VFDPSRYIKGCDAGQGYGVGFYTIGASQKFVFSGVQLLLDVVNANCFYNTYQNTANTTLSSCIFKIDAASASWAIYGRAPGATVNVDNCVVADTALVARCGGIRLDGFGWVYNTLIRGVRDAFDDGGSNFMDAKNVSAFDCSVGTFLNNATPDYCATSAGTGTHPIIVTDWSAQFVNPNFIADCDYRLKAGSVLLDSGVGPAIASTHNNIAIGKTIECKTIYSSYVATNGNDNNTATYSHSSVHSYEWSKIDLGASYDVWSINYIKRQSYPDWPSDFSFQTADDWAFTTNVVTLATYSDSDPTKLLSLLTPVNARYFRIQCNSSSMPFMVAEFQIFVSKVPLEDIVGAPRSGNTASVGPFEDPTLNPTRVTVVVVG